MQTTVISVKIDQKTKDEAQQVADELGFSLSAVIKAQLRQFIRSRRIVVALPEEPNEYLRQSLRTSDEDIAAGRTRSFATGQDVLAYLDSLIAHDKHNQ